MPAQRGTYAAIPNPPTTTHTHLYNEQTQSRLHRNTPRLTALTLALALLALLYTLLWSTIPPRPAVSPFQPLPFGIGIDLSTTHATAAIAWPNGTFTDAAWLDASVAYRAVIRELATHPPVSSRMTSVTRSLRKALGLAPSHATGVLGSMISALLTKAERRAPEIAGRVTALAVAVPGLPGFDDVESADLFWHLSFASRGPRAGVLAHAHAVPAGFGKGLCMHWEDGARCRREERRMGWTKGVTLGWEEDGVEVDAGSRRAAGEFLREERFEAGVWYGRGVDSVPRDDEMRALWWAGFKEDVRRVVLDLLEDDEEQAIGVALYGDFGADREFVGMVREVIREEGLERAEVLCDASPYVAARGAATVAMRGIAMGENETDVASL